MRIWRLEVDFQDYESYKLVNEDRQYIKDFKAKFFSAKEFKDKFELESIKLVEGEKQIDQCKTTKLTGDGELYVKQENSSWKQDY